MSDTSNKSNINCNEMLLDAVRKHNLGEVESLLKHPNLNVSYDIGDGNTILFESLFTKDESIFLSLINAGFDVNFRNQMQETPLHTAVIYSPINFVHELIKRGVDINAQEQCRHTPLSHAAFHGELDAVCMLLYYGADVNLVCTENRTPIMWALENDYVEISKVLFNYYIDFSCESVEGATALHFAIRTENPIAVDIINLEKNKTECVDTLLCLCLEHDTNKLFKFVLSKYEQETVVDELFFLHYFSVCSYSNSEWLECLHLLFTVAKILFKPLIDCKSCDNVFMISDGNLISKLFLGFHKRRIECSDRMTVIYLFLSSGAKITVEDVNIAYLLYGFNEEMEALIYTFDYRQNIVPNKFLPLPRFIFLLEDNYNTNIIPPVFQYLEHNSTIRAIAADIMEDVVSKSLGFCSMSNLQKGAAIHLCVLRFENMEHILMQVYAIPEVPSLRELSRNRVRQLIKQHCNITKSYQFYTIVKELNLPQIIQNVICFKTNIY